ncbi:hypothetical protein [Natrinema versiforme]|uniref:Uncharacterized protein n=1 Tax=Natrinema versiforme TaxID=88724 RepID=A0A4P8WNG6_9EURY|nr:hypothetical protein [Natrinema versiforme]QCS44742.1 hypothetical protein FEJ81_20930 [Natrinema versiforme]
MDDTAGNTCPSTSPGESSTHARCVALAVATLQEKFDSQARRCAAEVDLDVSESGSGNKTRRADALVEFTDENPFFGNGLVVEVQHHHHDKDTRTTTHDYLSIGYSVVWLSSADFGEEQLDYAVINDAFAEKDASGYSVRNCSPRHFLNCESYNYTGEHSWGTVPGYVLTCEEDYEICTSRPCTLRRRYDEEAGEYVYDSEEITTPDLPLKVLKNTLVKEVSMGGIEEPLKQRYVDAVLEKALADRPEVDQCPGPKGFHEWGASESVYDGYTKVELHACQHCPVHLLTDFRGYGRTDLFFSEHPDPDWDLLSLKADPRQCQHRSHEAGQWFEFCPDCGVTNPQ